MALSHPQYGTMLAIVKESVSNDFGVVVVNSGEKFWQDGKLTYTVRVKQTDSMLTADR